MEELVAFAHKQGLFDDPSGVTGQGATSQPLSEHECAATLSDQNMESFSQFPVRVQEARRLDCGIALDGPWCERLVMETVALATHGQRAERVWHQPSTGSVYFLELQDVERLQRHHVTITRDTRNHLALCQHTYFPTTLPPRPPVGKEVLLPSISFLNYNIWHNQPAAWVYPDPATRWTRYWERMAHLASVIWASGADVVGLEEVRYDQTFGPAGYHFGLTHLLDLLGALARSETIAGAQPPAPFQFLYQPAMSFAEPQGHQVREDEGVALLSRFPIRSSDYLLLPRDFTDAQDGHQRVVLHAAVEPWPGRPLLHVCVTHFSLSAAARKIAASCIVEWTNNQDHQNVVLMGDLNAEPHEESLQLLREGGFRDAWADLHGCESVAAKSLEAGLGLVKTKLTQGKENEDLPCVDGRKHCQRARNMPSGGESVASFTFPTCNPVKRIDYVMFRGNLRPLSGQLCGAEPKEGGQHHRTPGGGMLERNGPVYASDHLAVLIHFQPTSESFSPIIS